MMPLTDIFFDLDHTLWDFDRNSALAFGVVLSANGIEVDLDEFLARYVPLNRQYWERYRKDEITQEALRYGRLKDTFDAIPVSVPDQTIHAISDGYIEELPKYGHLFDGALDTLEYLAGKYRLHIITNGFSQVQEKKIRHASIGHYFNTVTNSEMAGVKKPHRDIFAFALQAAGARPESSIMIGDCPEADVKGALDFGMRAILFSTEPHDVDCVQIRHLTDLKKIL